MPEQDSVGQGRAQAAAVAGGDDADLEPMLPQRRQLGSEGAFRCMREHHWVHGVVLGTPGSTRQLGWVGELAPPSKRQPDGMLVKGLARGPRWQQLLDRGFYSSVTEIAEAEKISKSYVSRILRLALLAPDLVEAILGGWADQRVMLEKLERPLPVGWEEQRRVLASQQ